MSTNREMEYFYVKVHLQDIQGQTHAAYAEGKKYTFISIVAAKN
jgi:hypothetical protein